MRGDAREVDDASGTGAELAHERVLIVAEVHQLDEFVHAQRGALLVVEHRGKAQRGGQRTATVDPSLERDREGLAHRHVGEQPSVLEAAPEAGAGALAGAQVGDVATLQLDAAAVDRHEAADEIEDGGLAGAVRADHADDLVRAHVERGAVDRPVATERHRDLGDVAAIGAASASSSLHARAVTAASRCLGHGGAGQEHRPQQILAIQQFGGRAR